MEIIEPTLSQAERTLWFGTSRYYNLDVVVGVQEEVRETKQLIYIVHVLLLSNSEFTPSLFTIVYTVPCL